MKPKKKELSSKIPKTIIHGAFYLNGTNPISATNDMGVFALNFTYLGVGVDGATSPVAIFVSQNNKYKNTYGIRAVTEPQPSALDTALENMFKGDVVDIYKDPSGISICIDKFSSSEGLSLLFQALVKYKMKDINKDWLKELQEIIMSRFDKESIKKSVRTKGTNNNRVVALEEVDWYADSYEDEFREDPNLPYEEDDEVRGRSQPIRFKNTSSASYIGEY